MHDGNNVHGGKGEEDAAPTDHDVATPASTPSPLEQSATMAAVTSRFEDSTLSGADTAVASRSQAMAAAQPPEECTDPLLDALLLGRYQITRRIGQGGMGAVYEATHKLIGKRVAVKVLLDKYAQKSQVVARLEQEARLASSIGHENIIDITDFGQTGDGRTFVVMEFLEGESLGAALAREGRMDEQRAIDIGYQIASALAAAHQKGVIHRDVKPDNVFLLERRGKDYVKVVDFGISKSIRPGEGADSESPRLTQTGMVLGTPLYMSPEQARGDEELDHRIDIYALGVILYELVTGEVPFKGSNYLSIISQVINEEPTPPRDLRPELSSELESVIMKALSKNRGERYQTMEEIAEDLAALRADDGASTARARITASRFRRSRRSRSWLQVLAWVAGIAVVISAVVVTVSIWASDERGESVATTGATPVFDARNRSMTQPDAAPPEPEVEVVKVKIRSRPPGAAIYEGGRFIGKTPTVYTTTKRDKDVELIAELEGHNDARLVVNPYVDREATVHLKKPKRGTKVKKLRKISNSDDSSHDRSKSGSEERDDSTGGDLIGNPYD